MDIPQHLQHKPIIGVEYDQIDRFGDAKYLSIGKAQWNYNDFSCKSFRHTGDRWSAQSEELQMWRLLDLTILLVSTILNSQSKSFNIQSNSLKEEVIDKKALEDLYKYLNSSDTQNILNPRLSELKELLNRMNV